MSYSNISKILKESGFQKIRNQLPGEGDVYRDQKGFVATVFDNRTLSISSPFVNEPTGNMKPGKDFDLVGEQDDLKDDKEIKIAFDGVINAEMNIGKSEPVKKRFNKSETFVRNSYAFFDNMQDDTEI